MSTPGQLRDQSLKDLRAARAAMNTAEWLLGLNALSPNERRSAALCKIDTHHMIVELENAKLAEIADALKANGADIGTSTQNMRNQLAQLNQVRAVIDGISRVLQVLGRIIPLLVPL
jgi:ABC-type transporter Mla subunit MlaD